MRAPRRRLGYKRAARRVPTYRSGSAHLARVPPPLPSAPLHHARLGSASSPPPSPSLASTFNMRTGDALIGLRGSSQPFMVQLTFLSDTFGSHSRFRTKGHGSLRFPNHSHTTMRMRSASISATKSAVSAAASSPARKPATATRVPKFLRCLYDILHMEDQSILSWSKDGTHFQIYSTKRLEVEILPKYFKHGKFASFQRQLNNFGFRKWTKTQSNVCTFSHNHYVRRHPQQLVELVVQQNEALAKADVTGDKLTPHGSQGGKRKRSDSASEKSVKTIKREPQSYVVQRPAALPLAKVDATAFDFEVESWSLMADISPLEWATKSHLTAVKTESGNETPTSAAGFADMTFDFTLEELDDILLTGNATENEHAIDMRVLSECYGFGVPAVEPEPWAEGPELIPADLELYMQDTEIWASH